MKGGKKTRKRVKEMYEIEREKELKKERGMLGKRRKEGDEIL